MPLEAIGETVCDAVVHDGDLEDAIWFSLQANRSNGVRRTQQDVRNAVKRAIVHRRGKEQSDHFIASYVGCDHKTVGSLKQLLIATGEIPQSQSWVGKNGVERVLPQPRTPKPEAAEPGQIDLEDAIAAAAPAPQPINYVDRSNDWIHFEPKAAVAALRKLPDPATTVARYPVGVGYTLPVREAEAILDWWAEFVPLWAGRYPEFQARLDKMIRIGQEIAREHAE